MLAPLPHASLPTFFGFAMFEHGYDCDHDEHDEDDADGDVCDNPCIVVVV